MKRLVILAMAVAPCPVFAEMPTCSVADAKIVVERLMAASFSSDCESELGAIGASQYWVDECKGRAKMLDAPMRAELALRTSVAFKELHSKDNTTYAIVTLHGPDHYEYQFAISRESHCLPQASQEWTLFKFPEGVTGCGEEFWASIPVVDYPGAFPISCVDSKWIVPDPE